MCTLTYIPFAGDAFTLTSNRDEGTIRKGATLPQLFTTGYGTRVLSPIDPEAGGTWIGLSDDKRIAVLLNGAHGQHKHKPPYRKSRGWVVRDAFGYRSFEDFCGDYGLQGIEPFTLVMLHFDGSTNITILRWDGRQKNVERLQNGKAHIWTAPKLYPPDSMEKAGEEFREFLSNHEQPTYEELCDFHEFQDYQTKMKRHGYEPVEVVQTLSTSQIRKTSDHLAFHHIDRREQITGTYQFHEL